MRSNRNPGSGWLVSLLACGLLLGLGLGASPGCGDDDGGHSGQDGAVPGPDSSTPGPDSSTPGPDSATPGPDSATPGPDAAPGECQGGPLADPIPNCQPTPVPNTGDPYADCVARINQFRWECQCLPPLTRWTSAESCADQQAEDDSTAGAHATFGACSESAQNECPGWGSTEQVIDGCLQMMWDEGPGEPFSAHGHYINMSSTSYTRVACGFYTTPGGSVWSVQDFAP